MTVGNRICRHLSRIACAGCLGVIGLGVTGCQVDIAGQTLPSPYYIYDDVNYAPPGPEFKLSNEAAYMQATKADVELAN